MDTLEVRRLELQAELDGQKSQAERNRLGQFATPTALASEILDYAAAVFPPGETVRFLDPAFGTGAFYSAFRKVFATSQIAEAVGFEIDPHLGTPASQLWKNSGLVLNLADFTLAEPSARFNLVVCNPPYVRHHHLEEAYKSRLQFRTREASGIKISGLAGLYCYFLGLTQAWMADGAVAGWLIPSEFMDVNYGRSVKHYLCSHRSPWYSQENRPPAPIICTYLGRGDTKRGRPFRLILNSSRATVANVYLAMYPTPLLTRALDRDPTLIRRIWEILNQITPEQLLGEGRVYGGGLHKLEPRELGNVDASAISALIPNLRTQVANTQIEMFG